MQNILKRIYENNTISEDDISTIFSSMLQGELSTIQITALLISLKYQGETVEMFQGAAKALLQAAVSFDVSSELDVVDCCGTGGDGQGLLNISTAVSFVAAACGLKVVKHGNRAVSSNSGSADVLEHLGIPPVENKTLLTKQLQTTGLTFLFAPFFHPAMKYVMPVRKILATRTIFNILGPLINPARPKVQLMGVYDKSLCLPIATTLKALGSKRALVVHGGGLDEIAIHAETDYCEIKDNKIIQGHFTLEQLGVKKYPLEEIKGKDAQYNAHQIELLFAGEGIPAFEEAVAVNCAALLYCANKVQSIKDGLLLAKKAINNQAAAKVLQNIQKIHH